MAINVNPPPQLRKPQQFLVDSQTREYMSQIETILFQLWQRTGGNNDNVDTAFNVANQATQSYSLWLQKQINGLPELTIDTSGFTIDTSLITTDKVIA